MGILYEMIALLLPMRKRPMRYFFLQVSNFSLRSIVCILITPRYFFFLPYTVLLLNRLFDL
jgi:hypothetical protein